MIIIMLGAPATGKGTVAGMLSSNLGIPHLSSGDLFRQEIAAGTEIGQKLNSYMTKGELVPDELVIEMVGKRLAAPELSTGVILDGFPRTEVQAEKLDEMLNSENKKIDLVVNLDTPVDEILERVVNRRVCKECKSVYNTVLNPSKVEGVCDKCGGETYQRDDDKVEKAKNRLDIYFKETAPLTAYYEKTGALYSTVLSQRVNRMAPEVVKDVMEQLKK